MLIEFVRTAIGYQVQAAINGGVPAAGEIQFSDTLDPWHVQLRSEKEAPYYGAWSSPVTDTALTSRVCASVKTTMSDSSSLIL